jgi:hypothetical protein
MPPHRTADFIAQADRSFEEFAMRPGLRLTALVLVLGLSACASASPSASVPIPSISVPSATPVATPEVVLFACPDRSLSWDGEAAVDLNGAWSGDDAGVYYIRQIGNVIWWMGMSGLGEPLARRGQDWTNVYLGELSGLTITGNYADVPYGETLLDGPVTMQLTKTADAGISLVRVTADTDTEFGGKVLRPCTPQ